MQSGCLSQLARLQLHVQLDRNQTAITGGTDHPCLDMLLFEQMTKIVVALLLLALALAHFHLVSAEAIGQRVMDYTGLGKG